MENLSINLIPFLSISLSSNSTIKKDIENIYEINSPIFYVKAKLSEFYNFNKNPLFNQCLGIVLSLNHEIRISKMFNDMLCKGWPYVYFYVTNRDNIRFDNFLKYLKKRYGKETYYNDEFVNDNLLILLFLAESLDKNIEFDDTYEKYISYLCSLDIDTKTKLHTNTNK